MGRKNITHYSNGGDIKKLGTTGKKRLSDTQFLENFVHPSVEKAGNRSAVNFGRRWHELLKVENPA